VTHSCCIKCSRLGYIGWVAGWVVAGWVAGGCWWGHRMLPVKTVYQHHQCSSPPLGCTNTPSGCKEEEGIQGGLIQNHNMPVRYKPPHFDITASPCCPYSFAPLPSPLPPPLPPPCAHPPYDHHRYQHVPANTRLSLYPHV